MDKNNKVWLTAIILIVVVIAVFILMKDSSEENGLIQEEVSGQANNEDPQVNDVSYTETDKAFFGEFLRSNISDISPEKEVLGGKFYITKIEWIDGNTALVEYEDGHIALKAEAKLSFTDETKSRVQVESFEMIESEAPSF